MTYNEFPKFLEELNKIRSFNGRITYANQNLSRIGSGSGRAVYDIDGTKVLKLAKNPKGVAQNEEEARLGNDWHINNLVTNVFDSAEDDTWVVAEEGKKVTEKRIKELTGIESLGSLNAYLRNSESTNKGGRTIFSMDPALKDSYVENEFVASLNDFMLNYNQMSGDLARPSSYGEVVRDGEPTLVLTDYGLSDEVYNTHYNPMRKQSHRMYEMFGFRDGNDDILADAGAGEEIRRGAFALIPYGVGDGGDKLNEEFISFVQNRNKYPTQRLPSLPYIIDGFHECVNNLKETLNHVENKRQFYENLLSLQEYLVSQNAYDRDPLSLEEYDISEAEVAAEPPRVVPQTLNNKEYGTQLAIAAAEKLGIGHPTYLGGGANGFAFAIDNNTVLKITEDISEADAAFKLLRAEPKYIAHIYNLYKLYDTEKNLSFYLILEENIVNKPVEKFRRYIEVMNTIKPNDMTYEDFVLRMKIAKRFDYNTMVEMAKPVLTAYPEANISQQERQETFDFLIGLVNIRNELLQYGIKSTDYVTIANLGYKNNVLKYFDAGGYYGVPEPDVEDKDVIRIPESIDEEVISEDYDRPTADMIANKVAEMRGYNKPEFIGSGLFGVAYDLGDGRVLKVTSDRTEALENLQLKGKPLQYIAEPYEVFSVAADSGNTRRETYVIILEKLRTNPQEFKRLKDRMDFVFEKIMGVSYNDVVDNYVHNLGYDDGVDREKVEKYMAKNPEDAKFFNSVVEIGKEAAKYGVESTDYYNTENLGYKKDGKIGFFDVGYGNYFMRSEHQPEEINVNEDLEYQHVDGDATQDEYRLEERIKSSMAGSSTVEVKKKCRLAGNGNTSTPCNQGDISNLNIKSLKEQDYPEFEKQIEKDSTTDGLDKILLYEEDDHKVYAVNGDAVRDNGFDEWVDGGHHYVDLDEPSEDQKYAKFIPEDEIWVDDVFIIKPNDLAAILLHETLERFLMKNFGLEYSNGKDGAHEIANKAEVIFRDNVKKGMGHDVSQKIYDIFVKKYAEHRKKKNIYEAKRIM